MSSTAWLAAGLALCCLAVIAVFILVPKMRLAALYGLSLPMFAMGCVMVFGRTGLDWLPVWLYRLLMYFTAAPAVASAVLLLMAGGWYAFDGLLEEAYFTVAARNLTVMTTVACAIYAIIFRQWIELGLHVLGGLCGFAVAAYAYKKLPPASAA